MKRRSEYRDPRDRFNHPQPKPFTFWLRYYLIVGLVVALIHTVAPYLRR